MVDLARLISDNADITLVVKKIDVFLWRLMFISRSMLILALKLFIIYWRLPLFLYFVVYFIISRLRLYCLCWCGSALPIAVTNLGVWKTRFCFYMYILALISSATCLSLFWLTFNSCFNPSIIECIHTGIRSTRYLSSCCRDPFRFGHDHILGWSNYHNILILCLAIKGINIMIQIQIILVILHCLVLE